MAILALVSSSVLTVYDRCMASTADSSLRMKAFEVARDNMEKLLSLDSAKEMVEYGSSDKYPQIQWQTTVEAFYEPITARMWIQAVCSAEYTDTQGQVQTLELTHWLTDLTKQQVLEIIEQQEKEKEQLAERILETIEEAADYAGVDVQTIQQWMDNGMLKTDDGNYIKNQLDLYEQTDGNPTVEARMQQAEADADLIEPTERPTEPDELDKQDQPDKKSYSREELEKRGFPPELIEMILQLLNSD